MLKEETIQTAKILSKKLKNENVDWMVVGTASLVLQGIDIEPADIDIFTTKEGAFKIYDCLKEYGIQEIKHSAGPQGILLSWFGKLKINNVPVEINGDPENKSISGSWIKINVLSKKEYICLGDDKIPILPIKAELEECEKPKKLKREKDEKKIKLIKEYLRTS